MTQEIPVFISKQIDNEVPKQINDLQKQIENEDQKQIDNDRFVQYPVVGKHATITELDSYKKTFEINKQKILKALQRGESKCTIVHKLNINQRITKDKYVIDRDNKHEKNAERRAIYNLLYEYKIIFVNYILYLAYCNLN